MGRAARASDPDRLDPSASADSPVDQALDQVGRAARASDPLRPGPSALADNPLGQPAPSASAAGLGPRVLLPA